jgi:hypothetical protein
MPCSDGGNADLIIALFYIRCDAAAVGYLSLALFKKLLNVPDTVENDFFAGFQISQTKKIRQ